MARLAMDRSGNPPVQDSVAPRAPARIPGWALLVVLVASGMGITSVYYHWKAPGIIAQARRARANLPQDSQARLAVWLQYGRPAVIEGLNALRLSARQPWLATYVIETANPSSPESPPEIWGVDLAGLGPQAIHLDGLRVIVELGQPKLLGRGTVAGDKGLHVPVVPFGQARPDSAARARAVAEHALRRLAASLPRDVAGASLEVRVAGRGS
jgi:hypothetical protein